MVNMLRHRQDGVNVNPKTFDMAFERKVMTANSQVVVLYIFITVWLKWSTFML